MNEFKKTELERQVDALRSERMNRGLAASLEYREYYTGNTSITLPIFFKF